MLRVTWFHDTGRLVVDLPIEGGQVAATVTDVAAALEATGADPSRAPTLWGEAVRRLGEQWIAAGGRWE